MTTTTSANLHKRRESPKEHDGTTTTTTPNDDSPLDDPAKLQKELTVGLVVGQWIVPPVLFFVLPGLSWRYRLEELWISAILCNALLIMALGYLVQRRIEHWHIRPTIFWMAVPPLMELASNEPDICIMALVVVSIPFCFVFTMWCARYGVYNTVRMGLQHLGRSYSLEGIFSRPIVVLTKRYVYDFYKLMCNLQNNNEQDAEDLEAAEKNKGDDQEGPPLIPEPGPEELARIRANTAKHLWSYQGVLVLLLVWSGWSIYQSAQQLEPFSRYNMELLDRPVPAYRHHTVFSAASNPAHQYREPGKSYRNPVSSRSIGSSHNNNLVAVPARTRVSSTVVEDKRASLKAA